MPALPQGDGASLPDYTILVPLYRESASVPGLVAALGRIVWPRRRLDIKLIVEAHDDDTRQAIARLPLGAEFEVVVVPPGSPRTKPRALQYALSRARGRFVAVYDAEDEPHPLQLAEAYQRFLASDRRLACLQAPLVVDNPGESWIAALFAIEYSTLFDGLLPALTGLGLLLPLGGTSNHFRREALECAGGWDPFNVTEDADLGVRLARFGFRSETLTLPTLEEAPMSVRVWVRQRTRWYQGWIRPAGYIRILVLFQVLVASSGILVDVHRNAVATIALPLDCLLRAPFQAGGIPTADGDRRRPASPARAADALAPSTADTGTLKSPVHEPACVVRCTSNAPAVTNRSTLPATCRRWVGEAFDRPAMKASQLQPFGTICRS